MKSIKQIIAFIEKELKLDLRFKLNFVMYNMIQPFKLMFLFFFIYSGFYYSGAINIGWISKENYIVFLILGSIFYSFFFNSFNKVSRRLFEEKYWQTIQGFLIAPASKLKYILGFGSAAMIELFLIFIPIFVLLYILEPISVLHFLIVILIFTITYLGVLGVGLVHGALVLAKENFQFVMHYFFLFWTFMSCFYYPIEAIPRFLHPLVKINPIYYADLTIKSIWMDGTYNLLGFAYLILFSLISLSLGILVFNKILKKGIEGY